jgi:type IV secretory pathway protease TraF
MELPSLPELAAIARALCRIVVVVREAVTAHVVQEVVSKVRVNVSESGSVPSWYMELRSPGASAAPEFTVQDCVVSVGVLV